MTVPTKTLNAHARPFVPAFAAAAHAAPAAPVQDGSEPAGAAPVALGDLDDVVLADDNFCDALMRAGLELGFDNWESVLLVWADSQDPMHAELLQQLVELSAEDDYNASFYDQRGWSHYVAPAG